MDCYDDNALQDEQSLRLPSVQYNIIVGVLLKRLVPHQSFYPSLALVCVGLDVDSAKKRAFLDKYNEKFQLIKELHGPPNYECNQDVIFE